MSRVFTGHTDALERHSTMTDASVMSQVNKTPNQFNKNKSNNSPLPPLTKTEFN